MVLLIQFFCLVGLEHLHEGGVHAILHRHSKTNNILLSENMVADWGLSKLLTEPGASHVSTVVKGKPGYLNPEYVYKQDLHPLFIQRFTLNVQV